MGCEPIRSAAGATRAAYPSSSAATRSTTSGRSSQGQCPAPAMRSILAPGRRAVADACDLAALADVERAYVKGTLADTDKVIFVNVAPGGAKITKDYAARVILAEGRRDSAAMLILSGE